MKRLTEKGRAVFKNRGEKFPPSRSRLVRGVKSRSEAEVNAPQDGVGLSRTRAGTLDIRILRTVEIRQAGPDSRAERVAAGDREERVLFVARIRGQTFLFALEEGGADRRRPRPRAPGLTRTTGLKSLDRALRERPG